MIEMEIFDTDNNNIDGIEENVETKNEKTLDWLIVKLYLYAIAIIHMD